MPKKNSSPNAYDLAIVGAGVSGLFAAWRLLSNLPQLRILFIEKLGRTGGRLQTTTVAIAGTDGNLHAVKDEEGGMRFNGEMPFINQLISDLGLSQDVVPFLMNLGDTTQHFYFRGTPFTSNDTPGIWSRLFNLAPNESGQSPGAVLQTVLNAVLAQNPGITFPGGVPSGAAQWQTFRNQCQYNGTPINQWGFWALMRTYGLTEECIDWLEHAIGFMGPTQRLINAGESLQIIFDFPTAAQFSTLGEGFGSIPDTLASIVQASPNVQFHFNESVLSVQPTASGVQLFTDLNGSPGYTATQVIFAIPRAGLAPIVDQSPMLQGNADFQSAMNSVQDMFLAKVGLYFNQRWWHAGSGPLGNAINLTCGPSFNDLPLGSVYCFQQYPTDPGRDAAYNGPAALTVYTDYDRATFWMEMDNLGTPYVGTIPQPANTEAPSTALVAEAMRQIALLFNVPAGTILPQPVLATFRVWGETPYGFGYHQYKLNVNDVTDVAPNIWNPVPNVFVCNEAWSPEQGWVEGALMATDNVLTQGFGLSPYYVPPATSARKPASKKPANRPAPGTPASRPAAKPASGPKSSRSPTRSRS